MIKIDHSFAHEIWKSSGHELYELFGDNQESAIESQEHFDRILNDDTAQFGIEGELYGKPY